MWLLLQEDVQQLQKLLNSLPAALSPQHCVSCILQYTGIAALVRGHKGTHQMRIAGVHTHSSVAHSEIQSIKVLYLWHSFLSKSVNQKNVPSKGSNSLYLLKCSVPHKLLLFMISANHIH